MKSLFLIGLILLGATQLYTGNSILGLLFYTATVFMIYSFGKLFSWGIEKINNPEHKDEYISTYVLIMYVAILIYSFIFSCILNNKIL